MRWVHASHLGSPIQYTRWEDTMPTSKKKLSLLDCLKVRQDRIIEKVEALERYLHERIGWKGQALHLFVAALSCGKTVRVVARTPEEALARVQAFIEEEGHDAQVVRLERTEEQVDLC